VGCTGSLAKADYRGFPGSTGLDINSGILQLSLNGRRAPPFLGFRGILVLFVGRTSMGRHVLRPAQTYAIVCFRT
jgi:hypothetical protein